MDRRHYLLSAGSVAVVVTSGCLGAGGGREDSEREGLSVEGSAPTLSKDNMTVISARAYNADKFRFQLPEIADVSETDVDVSPSPNSQADSFPPIWSWDSQVSVVEAEIHVSVRPDVDTGEYTYGIMVGDGTKQQQVEYTIRVTD